MTRYKCQRCGYETDQKTHIKNHLSRKNPCKCIISNSEIDTLREKLFEKKNDTGFKCDFCDKLFSSSQGKYQHKKLCKKRPSPENEKIDGLVKTVEELKIELIAIKNEKSNKIAQVVAEEIPCQILTKENIEKLKLDLQYYKNKKNEKFYQLLLENYLGGTHKTLSCGITDITTDKCHVEIKEWSSWKEAVGQLTCYNIADPKEKLDLYVFGKYTQKCKNEALKIVTECKINMYEFIDDACEGISIISIISLNNNEIVYKYNPNI
jgi:hypothetical protein